MRQETWHFLSDLQKDLDLLQRQAATAGLIAACRLNGTSDLDWLNVIRHQPGLQFYDYTKSMARMGEWLEGRLPDNYHLTFSRTETNDDLCALVLKNGGNVAVVTRTGGWDGDHPLDDHGHTIDGDEHDLTFLHPPKSILVLKAKGPARQDTTGFVIQA